MSERGMFLTPVFFAPKIEWSFIRLATKVAIGL